jgi:hypothetical protein
MKPVPTCDYRAILAQYGGVFQSLPNSIHLDVNRPTFVVQFYGGDKRNLVFRSATSLAATELSAEVGVVYVDNSP